MQQQDSYQGAWIDKEVSIEEGVTIEPGVTIKGKVHVEAGVTIKSGAYIEGNVRIGEQTTIWPGAVIGTQTQALKYNGETTYVEIGKRCHIREYVTINSSYGEGDVVRVGDDCLIMAYCHIAHHCRVGDRVIMSNSVNLAGHVEIESDAVIGGMSAFHQNTRVGCFAMVGGMSRVNYDVPPYTVGGGIPYKIGGINRVGLKRHGFSMSDKKELTAIFTLVYRNPDLNFEEKLRHLEKHSEESAFAKQWLQFCKTSKRGLIDL